MGSPATGGAVSVDVTVPGQLDVLYGAVVGTVVLAVLLSVAALLVMWRRGPCRRRPALVGLSLLPVIGPVIVFTLVRRQRHATRPEHR